MSALNLPDGPLVLPPHMTEEWLKEYQENRWLGLGDTTQIEVANPFHGRTQHDIENPHVFLLDLMRKPENFGFTCKVLFGKTLAPFQIAILHELWVRPFPMLLGSRGAGKSWVVALYAMLRALFNQGSKIVICGAAFRQAKVVFDYCQELWESGPVYRDIVGPGKNNGPRRDVDRCTLRVGDSLIVALPLGDGCLRGDTLVTFGDGFGQMGDEHDGSGQTVVRRGRRVWSATGFALSDEAYDNGFVKTKRVTTKLGIVVEGTPNHRLRVLDGLDVVWRRLDEMRSGDRILVDRSVRWHSGDEPATEDEAYALGLMVGDGTWTNPYFLGYATKDEELIASLRRGTGLPFPKASASDPYHYKNNGKATRSAWLARWGLKTARSGDKEMPPALLRAPRGAMTAFLSGLFDTDGHVQVGSVKGGITVGLTTTSERLARQVQFVLLHYGIVSRLLRRKRSDKWAESFELLICGKNVGLFAEGVGFRLERKRRSLEAALAAAVRNRSSEDEVPHVQAEMCRVAGENRIPRGRRDRSLDAVRPTSIATKTVITHDFANQFLRKYAHVEDDFIGKLRSLTNPDVYYDTVVGIEDGECETFDVHVPGTHEYVANGFFSHNTKIRGQRANIILADEFASISKEIFETVIRGFAAVSMSPVEKFKSEMRVEALKELGLWTAEHERLGGGGLDSNQTVISGTAYYSFNHFFDYWKRYKAIVESRGDPRKLAELNAAGVNWRDYSVIRIPVTALPRGFMDQKQIAQAKATVHIGTFQMEYGACFATDSNGFFKRSLIEQCVVGKRDNPVVLPSCGEVKFKAALRGVPGRQYVMAVDPASEDDNFSVVIVECWPDHRRIVFCWTTTRSRYKAKAKRGLTDEGDFYAYTARKIRDLLKDFDVDRIALDAQGGGVAVLEALQDKANMRPGEVAILPAIDPEDEKPTDDLPGKHVIEVVQFAKYDWVRDANHGMRKDFEDRALLFPYFDPAEVALAHDDDKEKGRVKVDQTDSSVEKLYDTLEDVVLEIEELKDELACIEVRPAGTTGRERWDTPETKHAGGKKGRLRKDRYSSLLMANMVGRTLQRAAREQPYKAVGGFAKEVGGRKKDGPMYTGPGWFTEAAGAAHAAAGRLVKRR